MLGTLLAACPAPEAPPGVPWVTAPDQASHDQYFPIDTGKHDGIACNSCHGGFDSFTEFTCIDCHAHAQADTDPPHEGLPGYEYTRKSCFTCHPRGDVDGAGPAHELLFPIMSPAAHQDVACADCHVDPADRAVVTCVDCHAHQVNPTRTEHGAVGGYAYETSACLKCHFDSAVPRVADHEPFRIDLEASHAPSEAACLECHTRLRADRPFEAADFGQFDCGACHLQPDMDAAHGTMVGYRFESRTCLTCHIDGEAMSRESHDRIFPISAAAAHAETDCASCHQDGANLEVVNCVGCHPHASAQSQTQHRDVGGYRFESGLCMKCHDEGTVYRLSNHRPFRIDRGASHRPDEAACLECHPREDTARPFPAAAFEVFDCTGCHSRNEMDNEHDDERGYRYDSMTCVQSGCHPDGEEADD